jgi:hydroxymethylglutaryl-CoA synthase
MIGAIIGYAAYVPRHRLRRAELAELGAPAEGSRVVASYDEDSTTMGVEAARRALAATEAGSLYFSTSSPAYLEKTNATAIHAALDLGQDAFAVDMAGSPRSAVGALRAAARGGGLAVLSDVRVGRPGSADEREGAEAAAAIVYGDPSRSLADVMAEASCTAEFLDRWRSPGEHAAHQWEERFGAEAYRPLVRDAARRALDAAGIEQPDRVVVSSPQPRTAAEFGRELEGRKATEPLALGYAGAADPGVRLAATLDRAGPDETILLVVAADGCDATVLRTTARVGRGRPAETVAEQLACSCGVPYVRYLGWRDLLEREPPRRPEPARPASPPSARARSWKYAFVGSRCQACGRVHLPPRRVCANCRSVDRMQRAPLAGTPGSVATWTVDRLAHSPSPPAIAAVVDFDGGGRYMLQVADAGPDDIAPGIRLELTFRRLHTAAGVHNYFWKARPAAPGPESSPT